jgi:hypothetical protein
VKSGVSVWRLGKRGKTVGTVYTLDEAIVSLLEGWPGPGLTEKTLLGMVRYWGYPETSQAQLRRRMDWLDRHDFIRPSPIAGQWVVTGRGT